MSRRRSTVYDAAALRLHPSGVRVSLSAEPPVASSSQVKNKRTYARRDSRGNWMATDAAGDGRVAKRRKIVETTSRNSEDLEAQSTEQAVQDADHSQPYKDHRSRRRAAFQNDLSFLTASQAESEPNVQSHLQPSSDFLKCLHHFTSHYYGARGQLFDSAKQYRKVKAEKRRLGKMQTRPSVGSEDDSEREEGPANEQVSDNSESSDWTSQGEEPMFKAAASRKPRIKDVKKDMYKAFDGSALLCIGMLLQAHIDLSLTENVPPEWEEELENYEGPSSEPTDFVMTGSTKKRIKNTEAAKTGTVDDSHAQEAEEDFSGSYTNSDSDIN